MVNYGCLILPGLLVHDYRPMAAADRDNLLTVYSPEGEQRRVPFPAYSNLPRYVRMYMHTCIREGLILKEVRAGGRANKTLRKSFGVCRGKIYTVAARSYEISRCSFFSCRFGSTHFPL